MLISVVDGRRSDTFQRQQRANGRQSSVIVDPSASQGVMTEVLKEHGKHRAYGDQEKWRPHSRCSWRATWISVGL